jgi:hypothetical protein
MTSSPQEPISALTLTRPDIWERGLLLATGLTGYQFPAKAPVDGVISACGGGYAYYPPTPREQIDRIIPVIKQQETELERNKIKRDKGIPVDEEREHEIVQSIIDRKRKIRELEEKEAENAALRIKYKQESILHQEVEEELAKRQGHTRDAAMHRDIIKDYQERIKDWQEIINRNNRKLQCVPVPEGAMEWLLHEVGHWVAASDTERAAPDYGMGTLRAGECTCTGNFTECRCGDEREWQAWAFEELILGPHGQARSFCPPPHRGGIAFMSADPIAAEYLHHVEGRIKEARLDIEAWRALWSEWVTWGAKRGYKAPWLGGACQ